MKVPPLLIGATLVYWGFKCGLPFFAMGLAILVEIPVLIRRRWDFTSGQINKVTDICSILIAASIIFGVAQDPVTAVQQTLIWLPITTFPILCIQQFSTKGEVDVKSLFLFKRKNRFDETRTHINLGLPYLFLCFIAVGAVNQRTVDYYLILFFVSACALFFHRQRHTSIFFWALLLFFSGIIGFSVHNGLVVLQEQITDMVLEMFLEDAADPRKQTTSIGDIGSLKLSNTIVFRVTPDKNTPPPYLLKEASYNYYSKTTWFAAYESKIQIGRSPDGAYIINPGLSNTTAITITSRLKNRKGLLRLPGNTGKIKTASSPDLTINGFGAVMVENGPGLISYDAFFSPATPYTSKPLPMDLQLPEEEKEIFTSLARELNLQGSSADQKMLNRIKHYFFTHFTYSLSLEKTNKETPLAYFMTSSRKGHCEYFATASVLLLRAAGIPARYVSGYLAYERSLLERRILVRRAHAHAWCEVWINDHWEFLDATPPSWTLAEQPHFLESILPDLFSYLSYGILYLRWSDTEFKKQILWLLVPLAFLIIRRLLQDRNKKRKFNVNPQVPDEGSLPVFDNSRFSLYELEKRLNRIGYQKEPFETYENFLIRIEKKAFQADTSAIIGLIIQQHNNLRFGPATPDPDLMARYQRQCEILTNKIIPDSSQ